MLCHAEYLFEGDFESGELSGDRYRVTWYPVNEGPYPEIVSAPVRSGNYAVRFRQEFGWGGDEESNRAEVHTRRVDNGSERGFFQHHGENWIRFSLYLDESWANDTAPELVFQLHGDRDSAEEPYRSPPLALYIKDNAWYWIIRWDVKPISTTVGGGGTRRVWEAPYEKGRWVDWVIHARWSHQKDGVGFMKIWKDGKLVVDDRGPNMFNDSAGMKGPQFGIYKWPWLKGPSDVHERIVFFDDVFVGDHRSPMEPHLSN